MNKILEERKMRKEMYKKFIAIAASLTVLGIGGTNVSAAKEIKTPVKTTVAKKSTRKPKTHVSHCTMTKSVMYVGPGHAGMYPKTGNWKSSNTRVATVSTAGDRDGGHKVTARGTGTATISCEVLKTSGNWVKGDTYKWIVSIKKESIRVPRTEYYYMKVKLKNKKTYLTLNNKGRYPKTKDWKSSNSKIASVSAKESSKGVHKVTYKKKGIVTISCKAANSTGKVVKGDVYKWIIMIK